MVELNSPKASSPGSAEGFIGDCSGNTTSGSTDFSTFAGTYNDGSNPNNQQQQVVSTVAVP